MAPTSPAQPASTVVAVNLAGTDVGGGFGRASTVAVAHVADHQVTDWTEHPVGWDALHGQGPEGTHHGRIVRFLREHDVAVVVAGHLGPPMHHTMTRLGIKVVTSLTGDARAAVVAAVDAPASPPATGPHNHGPAAPTDLTITPPPR